MKSLIEFIDIEIYMVHNIRWIKRLMKAKEMEDLVGRQIMKDFLKEYGIRC